ncbi:MAG: efflux RND transporter periplasmic adaptor subunit [Chloroflexi bacterium]|nr:efflux RND transporter periplasmic adaptor subunit [Chloroflexota bacterium]
MKHWKRVVTTFTIVAVTATSLAIYGCSDSSDDESESGESQIVEVTRGTLMTQISSFGSISMPEQAELTFGSGQSANDLYTVSEINVEFGDTVKEGDILAKLDTASLERAVTQAESDLRTTQIDLEQATSQTNLLKAEAAVKSAEVSLARAEQELEEARNFNLSDAETDLEIAQRNLDTTQKNIAINITDAQNNVDSAYQTYSYYVNENIDKLTIGSVIAQADNLFWAYEKALENLEIAKSQAETSIATAEAAVTAAENALLNAPLDTQQKEADVASAKATLAQEQDDLTYIEAGYDIELLQINVDNAQVELDDVMDALEAATIIAPYDGIVAWVGADVGDEVTANNIIVHLVNTGVVEIDAAVDEIDVASVETGQMAMVELDALPDAKLRGQVSAVSPVAASQSSLVTFDIVVAVQGADKYELKEGMSATITIIAMDVEDVLLVPSNAIQRTAEGNVVEVVTGDDQTEERSVEIGASNGQQTEVIGGLAEGEQVVVQSSSSDVVDMMEKMMQGGRIPGMGGGQK